MTKQYLVTYTSMLIDADSPEEAVDKAGDSKGGGNWEAQEIDPKTHAVVRENTVALDSPCRDTGHGHSWRLTEDGYSRRWHTRFHGDTIIAKFTGTEDWTDNGDCNEYLQCSLCLAVAEIPEGVEVDYR